MINELIVTLALLAVTLTILIPSTILLYRKYKTAEDNWEKMREAAWVRIAKSEMRTPKALEPVLEFERAMDWSYRGEFLRLRTYFTVLGSASAVLMILSFIFLATLISSWVG